MHLPHLGKGIEAVRIVKWLKAPGEVISPGDDLLIVDTEPRIKLDIPRNAKLLARAARSGRPTATRQVDIRVRLRVTAAETATLAEILGTEGSRCNVGDVLATVARPAKEMSKVGAIMRVVINEEGL
jgi:hypothetical protein